jgi:hypothetical protein
MRAWICAASIAALTGCGDDGVTIDTSASNICSEMADVACHNLYSCCTEGEIEDFLNVTERQSEEQCREDVKITCERNIAPLRHSLELKRVKFDSNLANNCLAALLAPGGTCAEVLPELPWAEVCMVSSWTGLVPAEGECEQTYECANAPDAFCAPSRKCQAKAGHGQPCGQGCAHEFYCSSNICQPRLPAGSTCQSTSQCQEKLFCDTSMVMPVCTAPQPAGAACTSDTACQSGDCIPGSCAGPNPSICYEDNDCNGRCGDDGSFCTTAANCGTGTCMMSGFSCSSPTSCGVSDTCVFPVQCVPGDCLGDPVCSIPRVVVDYCEATLGHFSVSP